MWDELINYTQLPLNASNKIISILINEREEEQTYQFLTGLKDAMFETVRSNIIQQEPVPKLKIMLSMITKEEQHQYLAKTVDEKGDGATFAAVKTNQAGAEN